MKKQNKWQKEFDKQFGENILSIPIASGEIDECLVKQGKYQYKAQFLNGSDIKAFITSLLAQHNKEIVERAKEIVTDLLIKCECEKGDCPNCLRTAKAIDDIIDLINNNKDNE